MRQQIGKSQLALLIVLFVIGSTPLFELGIKAKQNSWIAMTMAAAAGLLLTAMYLFIQRRAPDAELAKLYKIHFGKWIGSAVGMLHAVWFAYESMRNVRDVGELTSAALLNITPKWLIMLFIVLVAVYTVSKGVEVFVRVVQLLFPIAAVSYLLLIILLFFSGLVKFDQLLPVMEDGPMPVIQAAFPDLVSFPFAQLVVMFMFWNLVKERKSIAKVTLLSQCAVSGFLIFMNALILCVLGPALAGATGLPLLQAVQLIRLFNFLERLDIIVTLLLFIGLYVKITALYLASLLVTESVTGVAQRNLVFPIGAAIYGASFLEPNNTFHIWLGLDVTLKIVPLFQVALPLMMLIVGVRKRYKKGLAGGGSPQAAK
ncbi:GerAB/ArcD/ProY family transporter [Paenibacillus sp. LHD-117]|uniref:GerAB/ArcD/ProY family transporter n=1 Tax=Paenibacillus sp. LHD-117 TaxID=3071412 RepID=UPI0027E05EF7|nr:GerAB/ArcD/ProY family transporter [Paenibacillus sp. LHD-117]MDQ6420805.1 GerAB/ArcD/ProY family transporter [Paenibacillus sp. LHD-117]